MPERGPRAGSAAAPTRPGWAADSMTAAASAGPSRKSMRRRAIQSGIEWRSAAVSAPPASSAVRSRPLVSDPPQHRVHQPRPRGHAGLRPA